MSYHFREFLADPAQVVDDIICAAFAPPPPVDLAAWAEENMIFGAVGNRFPGPFRLDLFPFWRRILEVLGPDHPCRTATLVKSAQLGGTIIGDIFMLGYLDLAPAGQMCVHPTVDNGRKWVINKIRDHVRHSPRLKRLLPLENKSDAKATELHFERYDRRGYVMVTGANSPSSLSQHTIKRQLQDDLSKWEDNNAGDPEDQADTRSQAFDDAKIFKVGTPTIEGQCRTTRSFLRGTQEFYHVPCAHCDHMQPLDPDNFIDSIENGHAAAPFFTCTSCGGVIEEKHRADIVARGKWIAENPTAKNISWSIWAAYAPLTPWPLLAERYVSAKGVAPKEQAVLNDVFGKVYKPAGEAPEAEKLKLRGDDFDVAKDQIPSGFYLLTAGIDIQADRVEVGVWAGGSDMRSCPVDHIVISGHISAAETRAELKRILTTPLWLDAYGNSRSIEHACIDAGNDRELVVDFAKMIPSSLLTVVVGAKNQSSPAIGNAQTKRVTRKGKRVRSDRVVIEVGGAGLKAWLYKDLRKENPLERGFIQLLKGYSIDWYEQLCSERREPVRDPRGFVKYLWRVISGRRNEVLDCAVYARAALLLVGWSRLKEDQWQIIANERDIPAPAAQLDLLSLDISQQIKPAPPKKMPSPENKLSSRSENAAIETPQTAPDWLSPSGDWL